MGPLALFDKSFLQSLSLNESVWFGHFFNPVICPLFYVETLGDLEKAVRAGRTPEKEVGILADKFPENSGGACVYHGTLAIGELLGHSVPMDRRVPLGGGRSVIRDGKHGVVFDHSPEAAAFSRWHAGKFLEIEREMARAWRTGLSNIDLKALAGSVRELGIDAKSCPSLQVARDIAEQLVVKKDKPFERIKLVFDTLSIPEQYKTAIIKRWSNWGYGSIASFAPYVAHIIRVELFFQFALASNLISSDRPSHRVDMAYLYYLPFCHVFVSLDKLHRTCAPFFLRQDQEFVWGADLKADLANINDHFTLLTDEEKEKGIMAFAHVPPKRDGSIVRRLRDKCLGEGYDDQRPIDASRLTEASSKKLADELLEWSRGPSTGNLPSTPSGRTAPDMLSIQRKVRPRRGSWWQVPKTLYENKMASRNKEDPEKS